MPIEQASPPALADGENLSHHCTYPPLPQDYNSHHSVLIREQNNSIYLLVPMEKEIRNKK
jgi:hypothetical protein